LAFLLGERERLGGERDIVNPVRGETDVEKETWPANPLMLKPVIVEFSGPPGKVKRSSGRATKAKSGLGGGGGWKGTDTLELFEAEIPKLSVAIKVTV